jgi:hypothetical protein
MILMARLVDETLEALRQIDLTKIDDALLLGLSFYEKSRGWLGILPCPEVLDEETSAQDLVDLRSAMIDLVRAHPLEDFATTAVFVLDRWEDLSLKPLFVEFMKTSYDNDRPQAMFSAMVALNGVGEKIFSSVSGRSSASISNIERNRELAVNYMKKEHLCQ